MQILQNSNIFCYLLIIKYGSNIFNTVNWKKYASYQNAHTWHYIPDNNRITSIAPSIESLISPLHLGGKMGTCCPGQ